MAEHVVMGFGLLFPVVGLIVAACLMWGHGFNLTDLIMVVVGYCLTGLSITIGYHRLFTHRAFAAGPVVRGILAIIGSMASQGPVLEWCAMHRQHHKHSDRDGDPHSPHLHGDGIGGFFRGMWHAHIGWLFHRSPPGIAKSIPDLLADPVLVFIDRTYMLWSVVGWIVPGVIGALVPADSSWSWFGFLTGVLWGGLVRQFLLHHTTFSVNSVCHVWGTRPFKSSDESRNNPIIGVLTFGEGWHNNHHAFPTSARHGLQWWQLDVSWLIIRGLQAVGLAWDVRLPSQNALEVRRNHPVSEPAPA